MSEPEQQTQDGLIPTGASALATRSSRLVTRGLELIRDGQLKKPKVLVTDDCRETGEAIKISLEGSGYEVVFIQHKDEAVARLGEIKPDVVTTDLASPRLGGFDFIRLVKEFDRSIPVIVISGNVNTKYDNNKDNIRKALQLGASACLAKPFDVSVLREMIEVALEIRHRKLSESSWGVTPAELSDIGERPS